VSQHLRTATHPYQSHKADQPGTRFEGTHPREPPLVPTHPHNHRVTHNLVTISLPNYRVEQFQLQKLTIKPT